MSEATELHEGDGEARTRQGASPPREPEGLDALFERLESADHWTRRFVREHPVASVAAVAVAGFVVGRLAARYR